LLPKGYPSANWGKAGRRTLGAFTKDAWADHVWTKRRPSENPPRKKKKVYGGSNKKARPTQTVKKIAARKKQHNWEELVV